MYKRPEFPPDMPVEIQEQIIQVLDKIDHYVDGWKIKLSGMSQEEFLALTFAMEMEKEARIVRDIANIPAIKNAVLSGMGFEDTKNGKVN